MVGEESPNDKLNEKDLFVCTNLCNVIGLTQLFYFVHVANNPLQLQIVVTSANLGSLCSQHLQCC